MKLIKEQRTILKTLDESVGWTTGHVAEESGAFGNLGKRIASARVRNVLIAMEKAGYVRALDDQKPTRWLRTPGGTAYLREFEGKVAEMQSAGQAMT